MTTETTTARGFADLDTFREANRSAGHHFFDADTMRAFRSQLPDAHMYAGRFFITSEQFVSGIHREPRAYTVRIAKLDGTTGGDVGAFQEWHTLAAARKAATDAAAGYAAGLDVLNIEGTAYNEAFRAGWALRRFEDANAPDKYGNTRADYLRADVKRLQQQIDAKNAEIAELA